MARSKINLRKLASLEEKAILVESQYEGTIFAIDRQGRGMWILSNGQEISIDKYNVEGFAAEILEVWGWFKKE